MDYKKFTNMMNKLFNFDIYVKVVYGKITEISHSEKEGLLPYSSLKKPQLGMAVVVWEGSVIPAYEAAGLVKDYIKRNPESIKPAFKFILNRGINQIDKGNSKNFLIVKNILKSTSLHNAAELLAEAWQAQERDDNHVNLEDLLFGDFTGQINHA